MDREPKPVGKNCLVEAYFTRKEMTGLILISGPTNMDTLWELEPILEPTHSLVVQLEECFPNQFHQPKSVSVIDLGRTQETPKDLNTRLHS